MEYKVKRLLIPLFAALTAVGAWLTIPWYPVPFSLQLYFTYLCGFILGAKEGAASQLLYIVIGLAGIPIFAGAKGGVSIVFSPTFGYLAAFPLAALITGFAGKCKPSFLKYLLSSFVALIIVYTIGISYLLFAFNYFLHKPITIGRALQVGIIPFILPDLLKCTCAAFTGIIIKERLPFIARNHSPTPAQHQKD